MSTDLTDITGSDIQKEIVGERRRRNADTLESDLKWLMSTRRGRRIVYRELEAARVFHTLFRADPQEMAFEAGKKDSGLRWLNAVTSLCPDRFVLMLQERKDDRASESADAY